MPDLVPTKDVIDHALHFNLKLQQDLMTHAPRQSIDRHCISLASQDWVTQVVRLHVEFVLLDW